MQRWVSADPLEVHEPGEADLNLYAYVRGQALKAVDLVGLEDTVANKAHADFLRSKATAGSAAAGVPEARTVAQPAADNPLNSPETRARLAELSGKTHIASTATKFDADHIVSFRELAKDPMFRRLTAQQQMEVLHMRENLSMLASDVNQQLKGGMSVDEFAKKYNIRDPKVDAMVHNARAALTQRMEAMVAKNVAQRVNPMVESAKYLKKHFPDNKLAQKAFEGITGRLSASQRAQIGPWAQPKPQVRVTPARVSPGVRGAARVGGAAGIGIGIVTIGADLFKLFRGDYSDDRCAPPDCS